MTTADARGRVHRLLRRPLVHFVALGATLALVLRGRGPAPVAATSVEDDTIVVAATQVEALRARFRADVGRDPGPDDERALIGRLVDEEILWREAVARGLDRRDPGIADRLVEIMRALSEDATADAASLEREARALGIDRADPVLRRMLAEEMRLLLAAAPAQETIDDAALAAWMAAHAERYRQPARVTFEHVFLAGAGRDAEARALRERLLAGADPGAMGDAWPLGGRVAGATDVQVRGAFGAAFADAVAALPTGTWSGPIASAHGIHLVRVAARAPAALPPVAAVRRQLLEEVRGARRQERLDDAMAALRARWRVRVEDPIPTP